MLAGLTPEEVQILDRDKSWFQITRDRIAVSAYGVTYRPFTLLHFIDAPMDRRTVGRIQKTAELSRTFLFVAICRLSDFVENSIGAIPTRPHRALSGQCLGRRRTFRRGSFRACPLVPTG